MGCGVDRKRSSDPALLCLWRRPEATAPIRLLAWEPPYAMGRALEKAKRPKKEKKKRRKVKYDLLVPWISSENLGAKVTASLNKSHERNSMCCRLLFKISHYIKWVREVRHIFLPRIKSKLP